jgi:hypothetical protein
MLHARRGGSVAFVAFVVSCTATRPDEAAVAMQDSWAASWVVDSGLALSVDSRGYTLPTAIAFVPRPGTSPTSPLYFVTEMNGIVKVVTVDRSVHEFARVPLNLGPNPPKPSGMQEVGLAGICLEPQHGYVFVTYAYMDASGTLRNGMTRYASTPETFGVIPTVETNLSHIFAADVSAISHQIGPCQILGEAVMVAVGDGENAPLAQELNATLGKILRMSLEGTALSDNPFYQNDDVTQPKNFVWALGLRNPFGLKVVGDRVFAAGNGPSTDNLVEIHKGRNYLWDGSDWSMGGNAIQVISPGPSPVQLDYIDKADARYPASLAGAFIVAMSGNLHAPLKPPERKVPGIMRLDFDVDSSVVRATPRFILQYSGSGVQTVVGVAVSNGSIYVVPLFPDSAGTTFVYRLAPDSGSRQKRRLVDDDPNASVQRYGCMGCHQLAEGHGGTVGPSLEPKSLVTRLDARLSSVDYAEYVRMLDADTSELMRSHRESRRAVLTAQGIDRVRTWIKFRILDPRFDNKGAVMPRLGVSEPQATQLAVMLTRGAGVGVIGKLKGAIARRLPTPTRELLLAAFGVGGIVGGLFVGSLLGLLRRRKSITR